jgi:hypothetical protein
MARGGFRRRLGRQLAEMTQDCCRVDGGEAQQHEPEEESRAGQQGVHGGIRAAGEWPAKHEVQAGQKVLAND